MQNLLQTLIETAPIQDAEELSALMESWPQEDAELQQLLEENFGELLGVFSATTPPIS